MIWRPNPILIIILLFSASELWRRWQMRGHPEMQEYYRVEPHQRLIIGVLYFGLAVLLVLGMHETHVPRDFLMEDRRILSVGQEDRGARE